MTGTLGHVAAWNRSPDGVDAAPFLRGFWPVSEGFRASFRGAESRTIPSPGRPNPLYNQSRPGSVLLVFSNPWEKSCLSLPQGPAGDLGPIRPAWGTFPRAWSAPAQVQGFAFGRGIADG
jgi:hypothetical protein